MAHYVIGRDLDGDGYYDYISDLHTMTLTEYPQMAMQFDDRDPEYINMAHLAAHGFVPIGITALRLTIMPTLKFRRPASFLQALLTPPPRAPRTTPRPHNGPRPGYHAAPRASARPVPGAPVPPPPRPVAPKPVTPKAVAPKPAGPVRPAGPKPGPGGRGGKGGPGGFGPGGFGPGGRR